MAWSSSSTYVPLAPSYGASFIQTAPTRLHNTFSALLWLLWPINTMETIFYTLLKKKQKQKVFKVIWNFDSFGLSAYLPTICKREAMQTITLQSWRDVQPERYGPHWKLHVHLKRRKLLLHLCRQVQNNRKLRRADEGICNVQDDGTFV